MFQKNNSVRVGKVVCRLGFNVFGFGGFRFRWNRAYLSGFCINSKRMNPHITVVGESGVGKSNAIKIIVERLCQNGANAIILDPHNEYLGAAEAISAGIYDAAYNGINIFDLDGMSEREKASELSSMFRRNFRLGDVQTYLLYRCIMNMYSYCGQQGKSPNIHGLAQTIRVFKANAKPGEKGILESLERRMSVIETASFAKTVNIDNIIKSSSLFLLSGLHTAEAQAIYLEGFLRKVYAKMLTLEKTGHPFLYVVIDEAEKLGDNPILGKIAAEGRKYGIGIIAAAQRSKSVDKDLRNNSSLVVSFYQREPEELNYISNFISGGNELGRFTEVKKGLRGLQKGYAMVVDSGQKEPFIVHFDRFERENKSANFSIIQLCRPGIRRQELYATLLKSFDEHEISNNIDQLLANGSVASYMIEKGMYAGTWYMSGPRNSAEHDICVSIINRHLGTWKIYNKIYNSSYGPDVIAFASGRKIAIEYETGMKNINDTKEMLNKRLLYYPMVIVVVNDRFHGVYSESFPTLNIVKFSEIDDVCKTIRMPAAA
ncbi:MAG: ATP-binding protein [Candidatus Micrarchaeota archaeon]|nr:ATP-binding protein [Candidatus Micrarchaeota archaeon]MDE1859900.1 ATP-binding protein [Candidatus Micrarchaeota archaeon]